MAHLHIIGIAGTAMAGLAALAQESGWRVTGSDHAVYPPMSDFLAERGIVFSDGFGLSNLDPAPDLVLVGNAVSRGNIELEGVLDRGLRYRSGAEWLHRHVLEGRHTLVVAGTHGKTTTASLLAWLWHRRGTLERSVEDVSWLPGFLIGGIPLNFGCGARFPPGRWVVVEGDEYDTAFSDKRAKFLHYAPRTLILNNLEYDHADIYPDLESIRVQFRLLMRLVPSSGLIVANGEDSEVLGVLREARSRVVTFGWDEGMPFAARLQRADGGVWWVLRDGEPVGEVEWALRGRHNVQNGLAAAAVALLHGMEPAEVVAGLRSFEGVLRRMQQRYQVGGVTVYDDFAHHPTAIAASLEGLRAELHGESGGEGRLWVVLEPRSNTMRRRVHQAGLVPALAGADRVILARPAARGLAAGEVLDVEAVADAWRGEHGGGAEVVEDAGEAVAILAERTRPGDRVVIMSNGGFDGIHDRLQRELWRRQGMAGGGMAVGRSG